MSVCFVSAARGVWGAEENLLTIAAEMRASGLRVSLVCISDALAARWRSDVGGEPTVVSSPASWSGRLGDTAALWRAAMSTHCRWLVLCTYYLVAGAALARLLPSSARRRVLLDLHDQIAPGRGLTRMRRLVKACDGVLAVSEYMAEQVHGLGVPVLVAHGPLAAHLIPTAPRAWDGRTPLRVGVIGRVVPEKQHLLVIEALAREGRTEVLVVRGGDGGAGDGHLDRVLARGRAALGPRFQFEGQVPLDEAVRDLAVIVVGNASEPMGRTVMEAQAKGVIAVVPDRGGSHELVRGGSAGYVYRSGDAASLASVLDDIAADPVRAAAVVDTAARHAADEYASGPYTTRLHDFLTSIAPPGPGSRGSTRS